MLYETLRTRVGPWVCGVDFFDREDEVTRMMQWLRSGHHISLSAQRRTGKTSLLREVQRLLQHEMEVVFVDVEECMTAADAVAAVAFATREHASVWRHVAGGFGAVLGAVESLEVDALKLRLRSEIAGGWRSKADRLVSDLRKCDLPVVLMLDEVPMLLTRLLASHPLEAEALLSWLRKVCMEQEQTIRLVLTGSIGLAPIASRAGLSNLLNHYRVFELTPWPPEIVRACLKALASEVDLHWPVDAQDRAIEALGIGVPYHVQLLFAHVDEDARRRKVTTIRPDDVARIYAEKLLGLSAMSELSHMEERLGRAIPPHLYQLALEVLTEAAVSAPLSSRKALDLAASLGFEDREASAALRDIVDVLTHDGYLERTGDVWTFPSHLLRDWWVRRFGSFRVAPAVHR